VVGGRILFDCWLPQSYDSLYDGPIDDCKSDITPINDAQCTVRNKDGKWRFEGTLKLHTTYSYSSSYTSSNHWVPKQGTFFGEDGRPIYTGGFSENNGRPYGKGVLYIDKDIEVHGNFLGENRLKPGEKVVLRRGDLFYSNPVMPASGFKVSEINLGPPKREDGTSALSGLANSKTTASDSPSSDTTTVSEDGSRPTKKQKRVQDLVEFIQSKTGDATSESTQELVEAATSFLIRKNEHPERDLVAKLKPLYEEAGMTVSTNVRVNTSKSYVEVDMVLEKESTGNAAIVEVKADIDSDLITEATGQLIKYDLRMREDMTKNGDLLPYEKARRAGKNARIIALPKRPDDQDIQDAEAVGLQVHWPDNCVPKFA
jgi:hypothetical protein